MQDKENKNSTLEDEADFSDSTKDNQEEQKNNNYISIMHFQIHF